LRYDFDSNQLVYTKYAGDEETGEAWPTWFYSWHCLGWRYSCTCFFRIPTSSISLNLCMFEFFMSDSLCFLFFRSQVNVSFSVVISVNLEGWWHVGDRRLMMLD
jgi:hypothetical protein